ncbi:MAG TPA: M56 family metallopeptidase [Acidobacteriota bacterium]|nr:M56 family metallopeptidase [Acidobacteriota bacterium]
MTGHEKLAEFSAFLWPAMADHLWQATIVAGLCLLVLPTLRGAKAKTRYALWILAFLRFVIPPALVFLVANCLGFPPFRESSFETRLLQVSTSVVHVVQPSVLVDPQRPVALGSTTIGHPEAFCIFTIIWIAGCTFLLGRWMFRQWRFTRSLRLTAQDVEGELGQVIASLKNKLGIGRPMNLRIVSEGSEPGVSGVWHPVLVLPEDMLQQLSPAEVESVLAHELVHIARLDNLWSSLQMLVCCIFWFYPVIWLLDRRLIVERERSCDERVIGVTHNSQAYISGLIKMTGISLGLQAPGLAPMAGSNLKRRIENMKKANGKAPVSATILLSSIVALIAFLYLAAAPFQKNTAQAAQFSLTIENSEKSPLQIVSATFEDISLSPHPTAQVAAQLINPQIVVKNNSNRVATVYVVEFRKEGSNRLYLNRGPVELAPRGTDFLKKSEFLWSAGEKASEAGQTWTVRLVSVAFKDGGYMTLHPAPIPPPPGVWEIPEAARPAVKQRIEPIKVRGEIQESKLIRRVEPVYPELAMRARVQGQVILKVTVDEEGNVTEATVTDGHPLLNEAAVNAVKQWKYSPTFLNGKPVPVIATVSVTFNLK